VVGGDGIGGGDRICLVTIVCKVQRVIIYREAASIVDHSSKWSTFQVSLLFGGLCLVNGNIQGVHGLVCELVFLINGTSLLDCSLH